MTEFDVQACIDGLPYLIAFCFPLSAACAVVVVFVHEGVLFIHRRISQRLGKDA